MTALIDQLAYRFKAIIAGLFIALVGLAEWFVNSPDTAPAIESVIPAQYAQFVPIALGLLGTVIGSLAVYFKRNGEKPVKTAKNDAPVTELTDSPATSMINTIN